MRVGVGWDGGGGAMVGAVDVTAASGVADCIVVNI